MDYLDFDLRIRADDGPNYPVEVVESPAGEAKSRLNYAFDKTEFRRYLHVIEHSRGTSREIRGAGLREISQVTDLSVSNEVAVAQDGSLYVLGSSEMGIEIHLVHAP